VRARANPFCGPADTTFRFVLLVVAAVAAGAFAWDWLWFTNNGDRYLATLGACEQRVSADTSIDASLSGATDRSQAVERCLGSFAREQAVWSALGAVAVLVVAIVIVAVVPRWKIRRRQLRPVAEKLPAVAERVHAIAAEQGIQTPPGVLWNRRSKSGDALAFGVPGHYRVALGPALVAQAYTDRPAFDAVVRHELAHIVNRDVVLTYFANAIWYAWCLVALLPLAVDLALFDRPLLFSVGWRTAVITAVIYLTRNGLLRAREHYADVGASRHDGPDGALAQVLDAPRERAVDRRPSLLRWHPSTAERLAIVRDPTPLLRLGLLDAFAAGIVGGIAIPTVSNFALNLASGSTAVRYWPSVGTAVLAALLGGVLATAVWRSRVAVRTSAPGGRPPALVALVLAGGVLFAQPLSLSSTFETQILPTTIAEMGALVATLVLVVAVYLWALDVADAGVDDRTPRRPLLVTVVGATALALAWAVTMALFLTDLTHQFAVFPSLAGLVGISADDWRSLPDLLLHRSRTSRLDWVVWVGLVGVPLAGVAIARRRRSRAEIDTPPSWAYLELPPPGTPWRRLDGVRLQPALLAGVLGGAAGALVAVAGRLVYKGLVGGESAEGWRKIRLLEGTVWIGAGAVLVTATVMAARSKRLPMALGLLAGLVAALVSATGILIGWTFLGDNVGGVLIEAVARPVIGLGLFAGLLGASIGVGGRAVATSWHAPASLTRRAGPVGWAAVGIAGAVLLASLGAGVALAGGTAPVESDFRDFALTDGVAVVTEVLRLEQQLQLLPTDPAQAVQTLRASLVPQFRALHDRAANGLALTRPVGELRDRLASDLGATADGLEAYAGALEQADADAAQRAAFAVQGALRRLDGSGTELLQHVASSTPLSG
jgi:Zn-dependent protease with chaperone function